MWFFHRMFAASGRLAGFALRVTDMGLMTDIDKLLAQ